MRNISNRSLKLEHKKKIIIQIHLTCLTVLRMETFTIKDTVDLLMGPIQRIVLYEVMD